MLREFMSIFQSDDPLRDMGERFTRMLTLTSEMATTAGHIYFDGAVPPEQRRRIYEQDIEVNTLERQIRKLIVAHLSIRRNPSDVPHCLYLLSLVKDVERLGDYAKNLSELIDVGGGPPPDDDNVRELREIRGWIEGVFRDTPGVIERGDRDKAVALIQSGRQINRRCDALMMRAASSDYPANTAVAVALGARYYKRFSGHLMNVLSSVVMPLHKLDFFDEDEIPGERRD
jgi:phosphate uptake regulator